MLDTSSSIDTSCKDWEDRIESGKSLVPIHALNLNWDEAERAVRVFDRLRLPDVIGMPTMKEAAGDWFRDIVRALFGSYDPVTHQRAVRELFLLVPKKNGKSSYAAAIMVVAMIVNRRPKAEALLIAPTKEIAGIAYKQAEGIIQADPELAKLFWCRSNLKLIVHRRTGAELMIKAADTDVITGSKSTYILIDETHEFAKKSNAKALFVEIRGALAARPDGFMIQITTQSKDPPAGVFKQELSIARKIRDGELKLPRLCVLYELPPRLADRGGWKKESVWPLVNPNLGRSVDIAFLQNQLMTAEEGEPGDMALLASQHFNVQVGLSLAGDRWMGADYWLNAADETLTLDEFCRRCEVIVAGIDGGGLDDLFGLCLAGRCRETKKTLMWFHAWCQTDVMKRKEIEPTLRDFIAQGNLTMCDPDDMTRDVREITNILTGIHAMRLFPKQYAIGLDPYGVVELKASLLNAQISEDKLVNIAQGTRLSSAVWGLERGLKDGTIAHDGSEFMNWCVGNAKAEQRGNAIYVSKQAAGKAKIDPLIAGFNAFMLISHNPRAEGLSVYNQRGILRA